MLINLSPVTCSAKLIKPKSVMASGSAFVVDEEVDVAMNTARPQPLAVRLYADGNSRAPVVKPVID